MAATETTQKKNELLTSEAVQALAEIKGFFDNDVLEFNIQNDLEYSNVVGLGNLCQKNISKLKKLKTAERKPYMDQASEVSARIDPVIAYGEEKMRVCANSINEYKRRKEEETRRLLVAMEESMEAERAKVEKLCKSRQERFEMYCQRENEIAAKIDVIKNDPEKEHEVRALYRQLTKVRSKKVEFAEKVEQTQQTIENIVPETPAIQQNIRKARGERVNVSWEVSVTDIKAFIEFCLATKQYGYLNINEAAVKDSKKANESLEFPGLNVKKIETTGFSGR